MTRFTFEARTRLLAGPGRLSETGEAARALGAVRAVVVTDPPLVDAGHAATLLRSLRQAGVEAELYTGSHSNPDSDDAETLRAFAAPLAPDLLIGLGGGSAMDMAKAANFLLTNGGRMRDYQGYGRASQPLLPLILIPASTGTGSEAQSYCVIQDAETRAKMACGAPGAAARAVVLDPEVAMTQPRGVRGASGYDALSHVAETWVTTKRNDLSAAFGREAWRLLSGNFERVLTHPEDVEAIAAMQWGAFLAGWAIEHSMLGAAHACANPLSQRYGTVHARALAAVLPHVVRYNAVLLEARYRELDEALDRRLEEFAAMADLPRTLRALDVPEADLPALAARAAEQWTGHHNPRPFDAEAALEIYRCAY
jgi:alcohol dehydrogenase